MEKDTKTIKKFKGIVTSNKMEKTITIRVDSVKMDKKYKKNYKVSKKYRVHDEKGQYNEGDAVVFVECRPLSKDKRWRVLYN